MIRAILVDDKQANLNLLRKSLRSFADIEIIAEFTNPTMASKEIINLKPDVLFLDIEMPGMTGFKLAEIVKPVCDQVIYITEYSEYGSDVFEQGHLPLHFITRERRDELLPSAIAKLLAKVDEQKRKNETLIAYSADSVVKLQLLNNRTISLGLQIGSVTKVSEILLSAESFTSLTKFIFFKKYGKQIPKLSREWLNQKLDRKIFPNLNQSIKRLHQDIQNNLAKENISLPREVFFDEKVRGFSTLMIDQANIIVYTDFNELNNWFDHYISKLIKELKLIIVIKIIEHKGKYDISISNALPID